MRRKAKANDHNKSRNWWDGADERVLESKSEREKAGMWRVWTSTPRRRVYHDGFVLYQHRFAFKFSSSAIRKGVSTHSTLLVLPGVICQLILSQRRAFKIWHTIHHVISDDRYAGFFNKSLELGRWWILFSSSLFKMNIWDVWDIRRKGNVTKRDFLDGREDERNLPWQLMKWILIASMSSSWASLSLSVSSPISI